MKNNHAHFKPTTSAHADRALFWLDNWEHSKQFREESWCESMRFLQQTAMAMDLIDFALVFNPLEALGSPLLVRCCLEIFPQLARKVNR